MISVMVISDILYLIFGQGNFIFFKDKSGNFEKLYFAATMFTVRCFSFKL